MRILREKELIKRSRSSKPALSKTNTLRTGHKHSRWTRAFHKAYPGISFSLSNFGLKFKIPKRILDEVYNKGLKAWKTGGSRVGANPQQWATARVYKFLLISKKKVPTSWYKGKWDPNDYLRHS